MEREESTYAKYKKIVNLVDKIKKNWWGRGGAAQVATPAGLSSSLPFLPGDIATCLRAKSHDRNVLGKETGKSSKDGEGMERHLDLNHWYKRWHILGFLYPPFPPQEGKHHGS